MHLRVIPPPLLVCSQTYIFTDGEDEELKRKIGEFYEGGTERHIVM